MANSEDVLKKIKAVVFVVGVLVIGYSICVLYPIRNDIPASAKISYSLLYIAISGCLSLLLITDFCIRFFLSAILGGLFSLLAIGFAKLLQATPGAVFWTGIIVGVLGTGGAYAALAQTSWIGHLCSQCSTRGKISERQIGRDFQFTEQRQTSVGIRTFAVYKVTHQKSCGNCNASWTWTTQESEQRN